jgi:coenzyme F420-0:L-glutamate ligase/coenzyme F420-1:gamma-L-glutamate ligase
MSRLEVWAPDGLPEVVSGTDLAALVAGVTSLQDGDVVVVTSKVVSKAEGRVRRGGREEAVEEETVRVVARRGPTVIVVNRLGLTMAAAGVDASNVEAGSVVLLPQDPDASARALRSRLRELTGATVGVVVTDTAGRPWRVGQTNIAVGAAGLVVADDHAGRTDGHGNDLAVTMPAVADEIASTAELAQGKLTGRPVAVVRGRADLVLPAGDDGPGAASLVRSEGGDLFGYGAREAVLRALAGHDKDRAPFGAPSPVEDLVQALGRVAPEASRTSSLVVSSDNSEEAVLFLALDTDLTAAHAVAFAHGWVLEDWDAGEDAVRVRARPVVRCDGCLI